MIETNSNGPTPARVGRVSYPSTRQSTSPPPQNLFFNSPLKVNCTRESKRKFKPYTNFAFASLAKRSHLISTWDFHSLVFQSPDPKLVLIFTSVAGWPASLKSDIALVLKPNDGSKK